MNVFLNACFAAISALSMTDLPDLGKVGEANKMKKSAETAFNAKQYDKAMADYKHLIDKLGDSSEGAKLNLAHCYFNLKDKEKADALYQKLRGASDPKIGSVACQQIGVGLAQQNKTDEALAMFKEALKKDPTNQGARHNYETLKNKKNQEQKPEDKKDDKNEDEQKDQEKKEQEKKEQEKKEQEKKEQEKKEQEKKEQEKKEQAEKEKQQKEAEKKQANQQDKQEGENNKTEKINMTPEKAQMILNAMKNNEIQYLQQNRKKSTNPKNKNLPDW